MYFGFDEEQEEFREAVASLLDALCPPAAVRVAWDAPPGDLDRKVWRRLAEMGVLDALVPIDVGGLGLDERSLVLVLEEAGRCALPHPIVETACVAPVLPGWTAGGPLVSTDLGSANVPVAADADALILHDAAAGSLHLVPTTEVELTPVEAVDRSRRLARVRWTPSAATFATNDPDVIERARRRGTFGAAAVLVGVARRMIDMTVDYVSERQQFGVPVGSFQAVKHQLADALVAWSFARPLVHRAAWSLAVDDPQAGVDVAMAKATASEAAIEVARTALQCHGAMGYTVEYDLHLFLKRAHALAAAWGDPAAHRRTVATTLGLLL